jgi:hypothetical protein
MSHGPTGTHIRAAAAILAIALAGPLLAACGGSSGTGATSATTAAAATGTGTTVTPTTSPGSGTGTTSASTTGTGATGTQTGTTAAAPNPGSHANKAAAPELRPASAVAVCLQKAAAELQSRAEGAKGPSPAETRAISEAAAKRCIADAHVHIAPIHIAPIHIPQAPGAHAGNGGGSSAPKAHAPTSAQATAVLVRFAECLRHSGLNIPAPNTSGTGPVIDLKGLDAKNQQTRTAVAKCQPKK